MVLKFLSSGPESQCPFLPSATVHLVLPGPIAAGEPARGSWGMFAFRCLSVFPSSCSQVYT